MIKIFTVNKSGKIELTKDELQSVLNEAYWEGYRANTGYITSNRAYGWWLPVMYSDTSTAVDSESATTITINYGGLGTEVSNE